MTPQTLYTAKDSEKTDIINTVHDMSSYFSNIQTFASQLQNYLEEIEEIHSAVNRNSGRTGDEEYEIDMNRVNMNVRGLRDMAGNFGVQKERLRKIQEDMKQGVVVNRLVERGEGLSYGF